jgi:hypothetical protein
MSELWSVVDVFLIDNVFQKISDKWQKLAGKNCFWLAKMFCIFAVCSFIVTFYVGFSTFSSPYVKGSFIVVMFLEGIGGTLRIFLLGIKEKMAEKNSSDKIFYNTKRENGRTSRLLDVVVNIWFVILATATHDIVMVLFATSFVLSCITEYFESCMPLPPHKSKIRQWIEKGKDVFNKILVPISNPAPIPIAVK